MATSQCTRRKGRTTAGRGRRATSTSSVLSVAPRLASTSARAAAPMPARRTESLISEMSVSSSSCSECTWTAAPLARNISANTAKFVIDSPKTTGRPYTAGGDEAAADKGHGRQLIDLRELADGVEHHDIGAGFGVDGQLRAPRRGEAFAARDVHHLGEPILVARRDDQQRVR